MDAPAGLRPGGAMKQLFARYLAILLLSSTAAPARVQPSRGFDMFSSQEEVQAGQQASQQVRKQLPVLPDSSPVTQYVQRLGAELAARAPGEKWPYSFHVVNQKEINAFALPGGPVYVNLGTIQAADKEADLLGTDIMYDTGFDPRAMADFFEKIEKEGGPSGPQFLSDHPNPGNRRAAVTKEVNELPHKQSYRSDSPEFLRVKQTVGSMH